jgi:hypothetical protein
MRLHRLPEHHAALAASHGVARPDPGRREHALPHLRRRAYSGGDTLRAGAAGETRGAGYFLLRGRQRGAASRGGPAGAGGVAPPRQPHPPPRQRLAHAACRTTCGKWRAARRRSTPCCRRRKPARCCAHPIGRLTRAQARALAPRYRLIMWDVLTYDYDACLQLRTCLRGRASPHAPRLHRRLPRQPQGPPEPARRATPLPAECARLRYRFNAVG